MLNFRLQQNNVRPSGRQPMLNRAHPFFHQQHIVFAGVAQGKGVLDLVTNVWSGGSATLSGSDANGPYVYTTDTSGSGLGACSFAGISTNPLEFVTFGCILWLAPGAGRGYPLALITPNTAIWIVGQAIEFVQSGGNAGSFTGIAGHTYLFVVRNAVGTASQQRYLYLLDLNTGIVQFTSSTSSGNFTLGPVVALSNTTTFQSLSRFYCGFATGSVLVPPAVQPAATFYSIDQFMAGLADPWGLWYA